MASPNHALFGARAESRRLGERHHQPGDFIPPDEVVTVIIPKAVRSYVKEAEEAIEAARQGVQAAEQMLCDIEKNIAPPLRALRETLGELRDIRMGIVREARDCVAALRDVRAFFIESTYETERDRLADFVALCERVVALKRTGALDVVADTIIKLSVGKEDAPA